MTLTLSLSLCHREEQWGRLSDTVSQTFLGVAVQFPGFSSLGRASVQRLLGREPKAPSPWPLSSCVLLPFPPLLVQNTLLPCLLASLLAVIASESITCLIVLKGPLPTEVRMKS